MEFAAFVAEEAVRRLYARLTPRLWRYPSPVRQAVRALARPAADAAGAARIDTQEASDRLKQSWDLKLAYGKYRWEGPSSWRQHFDDAEQTVSLHRWNWLLARLTEGPAADLRAWGIELDRKSVV